MKMQKLILWGAAALVGARLSVPSTAFRHSSLCFEGLIHPDMGKTPYSHISVSTH